MAKIDRPETEVEVGNLNFRHNSGTVKMARPSVKDYLMNI